MSTQPLQAAIATGRSVLSNVGHLSNDQAGEVLKSWVEAGEPGDLQAVIALHLSRECNRPELALRAATTGRWAVQLIAACGFAIATVIAKPQAAEWQNEQPHPSRTARTRFMLPKFLV